MVRLHRGRGLLTDVTIDHNVLGAEGTQFADNTGLARGLRLILGGSIAACLGRTESIHFGSKADWTFRGGVDVSTFPPYWDHSLTLSFGGIIIIIQG